MDLSNMMDIGVNGLTIDEDVNIRKHLLLYLMPLQMY